MKIPKRMQGVKSQAHNRSPVQERETAKRYGGTQVKGSGCGMYQKGDVRIAGIACIENKCTVNKSFSVTREMVNKIEQAAINKGEVPAIEIEFLRSDGTPEHTLCVIPRYALELLIGRINGAA